MSECYVLTDYWEAGYTDQDVCGIGTETARQAGGWLPVIYLDRNGKPIGLDEVKEQAIEAVPEAVEPKVEAAIEKIEAAGETAAFDVIAAQYRILAQLVRAFDDALALELQARAMEAKRRADDEHDIEILMLAL